MQEVFFVFNMIVAADSLAYCLWYVIHSLKLFNLKVSEEKIKFVLIRYILFLTVGYIFSAYYLTYWCLDEKHFGFRINDFRRINAQFSYFNFYYMYINSWEIKTQKFFKNIMQILHTCFNIYNYTYSIIHNTHICINFDVL